MATLKTISAALNLIDAKKENLKKAFEDLQSHSSLLSPLSLSWPDLDSHFTSLHQSLNHRFNLLQSLEQSHSQSQTKILTLTPIPDPADQTPKEASFSANPNAPSSNRNDGSSGVFPKNYVVPGSVVPRCELSVLCEKMDGVGLRNYVDNHFKDRIRVQAELSGALRCAPDPGEMVLEALEGFHGEGNGLNDGELRKMRKSCIILLKQFRVAALSVSAKASVKALNLAMAWKEKLMSDDGNVLVALGFFHLVSAFGLVSEFSLDEFVAFSVAAAVNEEFPELCRTLGLTDRVPDIVQKLIARGKHILAVKYVFEFNLADKIPPVPILKACVDESKKLAERLSEEGKSLIETTSREIHALKSVIKIIENHKLESEYPRVILKQRIEQLNRQKNMKRTAPLPAAKPPQHQQLQQQHQQKRNMQKQKLQQGGIKRPRTSVPVGPAAVLKNINNANSMVHHYQKPLVHPPGLFPEHPNPYMSSPAMPFGLVATTSTIPPYTGSSSGPYGLDGVPTGPSGNPNLGGSHLNSLEPDVPSGYYDRPSTYGGIGLQHYYQASYYPQ
ncbi:FRIGIDA-like protein 1 [Abrus precatorius]|uniref:FRIGIDA-like protein n=1 Tax=Abrus precatorius TaxID=3816 RepID=A0A8B8KIS8_ABRPR|nr:FRIGIDA-like protein 1 [Abrus precatorius]